MARRVPCFQHEAWLIASFADGQVEYVALGSANTVPGFYAGSTQFGVPYVEFTATEAARGQTASFQGGRLTASPASFVSIFQVLQTIQYHLLDIRPSEVACSLL